MRVILCLLLLCAINTNAQNRFDTQPALSSEGQLGNLNGSDANLNEILNTHGDLFDRNRGYFGIGLNWDGIDNGHLKSILGVTINDSYIYHDRDHVPDPDNVPWLITNPSGTRIIAAEGNVMYGMGLGGMTRVDFEIGVENATGHITPELNNTGALHGFAHVGNGVVDGDFVELRTTQESSIYSDNTNKRIWDMRPMEIEISGNKFIDHMRSGEFMVVVICLRRVGTVPEGEYDEPILSIRLFRQKRLKFDAQLNDKFEDQRSDRFYASALSRITTPTIRERIALRTR